jgi:hypothetical protein
MTLEITSPFELDDDYYLDFATFLVRRTSLIHKRLYSTIGMCLAV